MRYFPESLTQPGLGDYGSYLGADESYRTDKFLLDQMHALAIAIGQAKERGDTQGEIALRTEFKKLEAEYRARSNDYLTTTDKLILKFGGYVEDVINVIPDAIAKVPQQVAKGLFGAILPFALMYGAFLYLTSRKR